MKHGVSGRDEGDRRDDHFVARADARERHRQVERGAFGSPTFFVGNEMFFGKEQLREVEEMVSGK